jgi:hypothetical protein
MRILLDCHNLRGGPLRAEKGLFISRVTAILSEKEGVEWLLAGDRLPVSGATGRWVGRQLWKYWRLPRIVKKYKPDRVITVDEMKGISGAADERYRPLAGEEKEQVKNHYAEGKEYFLADVGGMRKEQIVGLLKAFSLFKKRQRSNMRMVLGRAGAVRGQGRGIPMDLEHYKYRSEVVVVDEPVEEEWIRLVGAAYVFVAVPGGGEMSTFNAWKAETAVIAAESFQDPASLAALMMSLYTNEVLRAESIGKGREGLRSYSWERSARLVWDRIISGGDQQ